MLSNDFKPALLVIDFQEDFCPPNGSLAVPDGRSIAPILNSLLSLPFAVKLATRDWHPKTHISFASNHQSATPYTSTTTITNPSDPSQSYETTLWPDHCIQLTPGAEIVPELDQSLLHDVVDKGMVSSVEMYSAFYDPFKVSDSDLAGRLRRQGVTDVYIVGLAADYCVKATAEHAVDEGFKTFIVEEGTKPVIPEKWEQVRKDIVKYGIKLVSVDGEEVAKVKTIS
ncbi:hypothetical protein NLU13_1235 [Sarocladium strictum]|uniref:nicotinamidase n=1 Tax=Sarocladium strictum TaxID=5046 RepID=A0AA39GRD1_SARSR|nr:hypothetical protein NLU13_1235 [Sarocladium strictum]